MIFNPYTQTWEEGSRPSYGYEGEYSAGANWNPMYQQGYMNQQDPLLSRLSGMGVDLSKLNFGTDLLNDFAARHVNTITSYPYQDAYSQIRQAAAGNPAALSEIDASYGQAMQNYNAKMAEGPSWARKYLKPAILGGAGILTGMGIAQGLGFLGDGGISVFGADTPAVAEGVGGGFVEGVGNVGTGLNIAAPSGSSFAQTGVGSGFWEGVAGSGVAGPPGFWTAAPETLFPAAFGGASSGGFWDTLMSGSKVLSGIGNALGGGASGFDFGKLLGGGIDLAAGLAPSLAAISYAKNQGPFDTSRLESVYGSLAPQTFEYDMNTQRGMDQLTNNLSRRGVMGSSFASNDMTNFNTIRELGRNDLVSRNALTQGAVANDILNAQVKERLLKNDLYGRALSSIGTALGGQR